jgi:hypothetical protein
VRGELADIIFLAVVSLGLAITAALLPYLGQSLQVAAVAVVQVVVVTGVRAAEPVI